MRINLQQDYFNKEERVQNIFLKAVLKQCEQNNVDNDGQLLDSLHLHHFFSRELELDINACSPTKNNLFARILQDLTVPKHAPSILVVLPRFFERIVHIYIQAKCDGKSPCDAKCSRVCTLGILSNVALAEGVAEKVDEALKEYDFYSTLLNLKQMCDWSIPNAITLIDTLSQRMDVAQEEILKKVDDSWFEMLLKLLQRRSKTEKKKEPSEFKQSVQSIMVNLAKWDVRNRFFRYNDFSVARVMVREIESKTKYVRNALIALHNFALHDSKEVLRLCLPILDSHLLRLSVFPQADYTVQLNAIRLVAVFFGKKELLKPDMAWLRNLRSGVNSANSEIAMWSIVCLAMLDDETLPVDIGHKVLEELVDYLKMSNAEEDFPIDLMLTCIYKLLAQERKYVEALNRLDLFEQLWTCLEIAWGNEHSVAFGKALECASICTGDAQEQLLIKFCNKFVDEENSAEVVLFNKFLSKYTTEFELELNTGKLIVRESEAVKRFATKLNSTEKTLAAAAAKLNSTEKTPAAAAPAKANGVTAYEKALPKQAKEEKDAPIKKRSKLVMVDEEEEQCPAPKKRSKRVVDENDDEEEEKPVEVKTKKKKAVEPATAPVVNKAPPVKSVQQPQKPAQPAAYVPSVFDFLPPSSNDSNNGGDETEDDDDLLREIAEVPTFGDEVPLTSEHQLQETLQQQEQQQPVPATVIPTAPKEAIAAVNQPQIDANALLQLDLISQRDHEVFCNNLLTIDVLQRMSLEDTAAFVTELREAGLSSMSAKRLLVHVNPAVFGSEHRNIDPEELVVLLLKQNRITSAETCHILNNRISLLVLLLMDDADYEQVGIRPLLKARLRSWASTL